MIFVKSKVYWRARNLAISIVKSTKLFDKHPCYFGITSQLIRAINSVSANLIESQSARSKKEFVSIHQVALREANESLHWLEAIKDLGINHRVNIDKFQDENIQIIKMITSIIVTAKKKYKL